MQTFLGFVAVEMIQQVSHLHGSIKERTLAYHPGYSFSIPYALEKNRVEPH